MRRASWLRRAVLGVGCLALLAGLELRLGGEIAATPSGSVINLPYSLIDGAGFPWKVEDGGGVRLRSFAFDERYGCFRLTIGSELFKATEANLNMEGQELIVGPKTMKRGLKVTRKIFVPNDAAFIRFREVIENPYDSDQNFNLKLTCHLAPIPSTVGLETNVTPYPYLGDQEVGTDDSFIAVALEPDTFERGFESLPWKLYIGEGKRVEGGQGPVWQCDLATLKPGDPHWQVVEAEEEERGKVAQAGVIPDKKCTALVLQDFETQAGEVSFLRKVSSESWDSLQFFIDGQLRGWWSGEQDWEEAECQKGCRVEKGKHTFVWAYQKSTAGSGGKDTAWIDDVQLPLRPTFLWALFSPEEEVEVKPAAIQRNRATLTVEYPPLTIPAKGKIVIIHFGAQYLQHEPMDLDRLDGDARSLLGLEGIAIAGITDWVKEVGPTFDDSWLHAGQSIEEGTQLAKTGEHICLQIKGKRIVQYANNLPLKPRPLTGEELQKELGEIGIDVVDAETHEIVVPSAILARPSIPNCIDGTCQEATIVERCFFFFPPNWSQLSQNRGYYFQATPLKLGFRSRNWRLDHE